ncbi:thioredoxin domain-containing protein [Microbacterium sp. SORGH_AS_0888]|uniref:DsbA family protein n=1 Tax=Microbacterium sp. SORGH_AS_0888 TaxID=3041791 RepID=UPI0027829FBC|nr:thioredoxin domain-containing protein [Microbacterium sp. SORGH_AS_0888]MDQ1129347.1 protein-disulfide isomerase [Microbacterium sp. SORGH_AS_0888]
MAAAQKKGKGGSDRQGAPKGYKPVKKTNWFAIWVSVAAVVLVVAIAGGVVWMNNVKAGPSAPVVVPSSSGIDTETGAIAVGTGSGTLDTYVDFMCPVCGNFEKTYGPTIQSLVEDGTITLNIHPISILDRLSSGTQYSTRSAAAMYAVAATRPDLSLAYLQVLFANQPQENSSGLTDDQLIAYAQQVGAGDAADAIRSGTYESYVTSITQKTPIQPGQSGIATPTIAINGEVILNSTLTGDPQRDLVARFSG